MLRLRTDKDQFMRFDDFGEIGVLRKKSIARMNGIRAGDFTSRNDRRNIEIGLRSRRRPDAHRFIGKPHMHRIGIRGRVNRHGRNAHFLACTIDPKSDLTAICDQDLVDHLRLLDPHQRFAELHRLTITDEYFRHAAGCRRWHRIHGLHCFNDAQRSVRHRLANIDEWRSARLR